MIKLRNLVENRTGSKVLGPQKLQKTLLDYLKRNYSDLGEEYLMKRTKVTKGAVGDSLEVYIPTKVLDSEDWNEFFKKHGYYIGNVGGGREMDFPDEWGEWNTKLQLFPYETEEVQNITDTLYHVTPKNKLLKIKRNGLTPRKGSKTFNIDESRIYFIKNTQMGRKQMSDLIEKLKNYIDENPPFGNEVAVLEINPNKTNADFYTDSEIDATLDSSYDWSVYTRDNIPPSAIVNWNEYKEELKTLKARN